MEIIDQIKITNSRGEFNIISLFVREKKKRKEKGNKMLRKK